MIHVALARYLYSIDLVEYDEAGAEGNCFTGPLPPEPDLAIGIRQYGGSGDFQHAYDTPRIQIMVRGSNGEAALAKATEIHAALHGLRYTVLDPGGDAEAYMVFCRALDLPSDIGADENNANGNGRQRYVTNYEIEHTVASANRD
jgi:hypothetical protein